MIPDRPASVLGSDDTRMSFLNKLDVSDLGVSQDLYLPPTSTYISVFLAVVYEVIMVWREHSEQL